MGFKLVIYRPKAFVNRFAYPNVFVDGEVRGKLHSGRYVELQLTPGSHAIKLQNRMSWDGHQDFTVEAADGATVFYRVGSAVEAIVPVFPVVGVWKSISIVRVEEQVALADLKELRPSR